ncbi:hypothetical protein C8034_v001205 [Colletotrichum sidae]|uniref:Apple domain-containing protein n=1 Tax=Colletotrichum sidae TaxID=1347389 RepID=A0A4R8TUU3_9PEZI|nr:hypothetical protein C8034_v001205 [Colletotrichum sidae]
MTSQYDEGPELAPQQAYPEVYHPPQQATSPYSASPQPQPVTPVKPEESVSAYGGYAGEYGGAQHSAYHPAGADAAQQKPRKTVCGCPFLVFLLSVIIAILAAAVIGLAAGTGVEASRANEALDQLSALQASVSSGGGATKTVTVSSPSSTATGFASISNNCSNSDETTTGQTYTTDFFGKQTFTMFCNMNAPNPPLMSLFTANFNNCMDACAAFTNFEPGFGGNATCAGVSFIPLWTTRDAAVAGTAPGNCYLKPGPQNRTLLETPNIGTECHSAILRTLAV